MKVYDSLHDVREKVFKEYAMKKQFEDEQVLRTKKIKVCEPLSPEQLKSTWKEQDHQVNSSTI